MAALNDRPWQPGDPVGPGHVRLPGPVARAAYGAECRHQVVEALARHVVAGDLLEIRRARLRRCPRKLRNDVEARVRELWAARRG